MLMELGISIKTFHKLMLDWPAVYLCITVQGKISSRHEKNPVADPVLYQQIQRVESILRGDVLLIRAATIKFDTKDFKLLLAAVIDTADISIGMS